MALPHLLDIISGLPAWHELKERFPSTGEVILAGGLEGSSDAVLVTALARSMPERMFIVVADQLSEAERWMADMGVLADDIPVALYPPREGFGEVEPHAEIAGERVETLERIGTGNARILLTTSRAVMERTSLPRALQAARLELRLGDKRRPEELASHLDSVGFERCDMVEDVAQYSVRGGIFDVYGFGMSGPVRMEFWGDEISDMRHFDIRTQRTTGKTSFVLVLPVDAPSSDSSSGVAQNRVSLLELLGPETIAVIPSGSSIFPEMQRTWEESAHHVEVARRRGEMLPDRSEIFRDPRETRAALSMFATVRLASASVASYGSAESIGGGERFGFSQNVEIEDPDIRFPILPPEPVSRDIRVLRRLAGDGLSTLILCDNAGQAERLDELLNEDWPSPAALSIGVLDGGFVVPGKIRVLTDHEIFRRERRLRRARKYGSGAVLDVTGALRVGDYVVHLEHGIGIYRGMEKVFFREQTIEAAVIEYEGGDRLNVPLYRIDQIELYRSGGAAGDDAPPPRLHKLGGRKWAQQREKTRAAILEMTQELLSLYAKRTVTVRPSHSPDGAWQKQLESSFLFEDTPDQRKATEDVKKDMESERPMDRLLVGDVGYGKTEIAIRSAFKAVQSGRQVAVLVPTTILAEQHGRSFGERLADFPVRVEVMSRFQTAREQAAVVADLASGKIDIVIGTHRLLSPDVSFSNLGLIVVDEEHRFGVKHKERLKQMRVDTDVLTLTATPIPRTLHQSLAGLRDMTLMQTPPRDRSPVLTYVEPWDDGLLEEGISRELDRGGQVFFVHNRIETIVGIADHIQRLVPRARIAVGHGQMKERELEAVMKKFVSGEIDILVSTLIVETGLDVPNANTMFVNRADRFGLAQLYQLRGRVGRSHRRAYCYLIAPDRMDEDSERRLKVLEHNTDLGSGYRIALKDMEMRGAGNLLGSEQSGFVHSIGFDLYLRLLDEAVRQIGQSDGARPFVPADVSLDRPCYIPDDFIEYADAKLDVYRRLSACRTATAIDELRAEVRDRFGELPEPAASLFGSTQLRVTGGLLGVEGILVRGNEARITFRSDAVPRLKGLSAAFHEVQFQVDVRRTQPLALKLLRLGGAGILDGLVHALRALVN